MEEHNHHSMRLAFVLVLGVLALVAASVHTFIDAGTEAEQAAVLRAYAE